MIECSSLYLDTYKSIAQDIANIHNGSVAIVSKDSLVAKEIEDMVVLSVCGSVNYCNKIHLVNNESIGMDDVRSILEFLRYSTTERRLVVINNIHKASVNAINALLKIIEEPPLNVLFLLNVPSSGMDKLSTILSRCLLFHVNPRANNNDEVTYRYLAIGNGESPNTYDNLLSATYLLISRAITCSLASKTDGGEIFPGEFNAIRQHDLTQFVHKVDAALTTLYEGIEMKLSVESLTEVIRYTLLDI